MGFLSHLPCWGAVYLTTSLIYKVMQNSSLILQLVVCIPVGLTAGAALFLLFPRPRQSAFSAWNTIKAALVSRFATT